MLAAGHRQHVTAATLLDRTAQGVIGAIDAVAGHPAHGTPARAPAPASPARVGLGREDHLSRHPASARRRHHRPQLGQIQGPVDQRPTVPAGIAEEHPDLAVLDPPRRAGILPLHPDRLGPLYVPVSSRTSTASVSPSRQHSRADHRVTDRHPSAGRENPVLRVARRLKATDVIDVLFDLFILRGVPGHIRSDTDRNSWPSRSRLDRSSRRQDSLHCPGLAVGERVYRSRSMPGSGRAAQRRDLLPYARAIIIESWRRHYNTVRPHASLGYAASPEVFAAAVGRLRSHEGSPQPATPIAPRPTLN